MDKKIFITKKAFSPDLLGRAIFYKGLSRSNEELKGYFLVRSVMDDEISVINGEEEFFYISIDAFDVVEGPTDDFVFVSEPELRILE